MMTPFAVVVTAAVLFLATVWRPPSAVGLGGSAATVAVVFGSATTVCTVVAGQPVRRIQCWSNGRLLPPVLATVSFDALAGGRDTLCGVRSGGFSLLCWNATFSARRIYNNVSATLTSLAVGSGQICGLTNTTGRNVVCWRGNVLPSGQFPSEGSRFRVVSSGLRFSCGVLEINSRVLCWGDDGFSGSIQAEFANSSMADIQVGGGHACGFDNSGFVVCRGNNSYGQLNVPENHAFQYRALSLGSDHSCAIRRLNRTVVCWGGNSDFSSSTTDGISFESITSGLNFTCGLTTSNFSVICWGSGWPDQPGFTLPLQQTLPGPCVSSPCQCNIYPQSATLCSGNGHICNPCDIPAPIPPISPPPPTASPPRGRLRLSRGLLAFAIVGSVGSFAGICSLAYCLWAGVIFGKKKIHNTVQPTISRHQESNSNPLSRSSTIRRQGSILMRRQRSGPSSKHKDKAEEFSFSFLAAATSNFSPTNKIGAGSFGIVYRGKLQDGREVAIKRSESGPRTRKFQEKESAFDSELAFLSRLHHKHLVNLVGYCEEREERLLVYEYMENGALYDHLHGAGNVEKKSSGVLNSWKMRIKIALDAARGIEYLHNYAVPSIIHRDIKSSNILLDANWTARVSDFGLSLMGPENEGGAFRPMKAAGTVGYIDPEYYGLNVLTAKSDVYGFGVVLLEILTGKRAIFRDGKTPISVVDFAVPAIQGEELSRILDPRVGPPERSEAEAVELVAYTAMHCVNLEGKDRPTMTDIVATLERALALVTEDSHGSISSGQIASD